MFPIFNRKSGTYKPGTGINAPIDEAGTTPLHAALRKNDVKMAEKLLRIGADPEQVDREGHPPLFAAIEADDSPMIDLLLRYAPAAKSKAYGAYKVSLLEHAVRKGCAEKTVACLMDAGCTRTTARQAKTLLHLAASCGHGHLVPFLIGRGIGANVRDDNLDTPLHDAAAAGQAETAALLIEAGAIATLRNKDVETPLHVAARLNKETVADLLLAQPSVRESVDAVRAYETGFTPLMCAAAANATGIIEKLVATGASVNATDHEKRHSLSIAVESGKLEAARLLLRLGADAGKKDAQSDISPPIRHWTAQENVLPMLLLLADAGTDLDARDPDSGETALLRACAKMDKERVCALVTLGADAKLCNALGERPIDAVVNAYAFRYNDAVAIVHALMHHGAEAGMSSAKGQEKSPLHTAAFYGHVLSADVMLDHHALIDDRDRSHEQRTALHLAIEGGKPRMVRLLLSRGARADKTTAGGDSVLHIAADNGHEETLDILLALPGIDVNAVNMESETPLHTAAARDRKNAAAQLLAAGADPYAVNDDGFTPLHTAMAHGHDDFIAVYAERGHADWNMKTHDGAHTLLHLAVARGHDLPVIKLLEAGADPTTPAGEQDMTALHTAIAEGASSIFKILVAHMEKNGTDLSALRTRNDETLLHHAARHNQVGFTAFLCNHGVDAAVADGNGDTALHIAAREGNGWVVHVLADKAEHILSQRNKDGKTPLDLATEGGHEKLLDVLTPKDGDAPPSAQKKPPSPKR